jgi:cytochrome c biogenesis protein CcmG, thiol:disulfide interchange protein DsbE
MMRRTVLVGLLGAAALLGACTDDGDGSGAAGETDGGNDEVRLDGDDLGTAILPGLGEGAEPIDLASLQGVPTVVNFWASFCAPCVREMPALEEVHIAAGDAVTFLGVAVQDRVEDALELADRTGVTYLLATDPSGAYFTAAGATLLPTTLVLDGDGEIVRRLTGEITAEELVEVLAEETGVDVALT